MRASTLALALIAVSGVSAAPIPDRGRRASDLVDVSHITPVLESRDVGSVLVGAAMELAASGNKIAKHHNWKQINGANPLMNDDELRLLHASNQKQLEEATAADKKKKKLRKQIIFGGGGVAALLGGAHWYNKQQRNLACFNTDNPDPTWCPVQYQQVQQKKALVIPASFQDTFTKWSQSQSSMQGQPGMPGQPSMPGQAMPGQMAGQMPGQGMVSTGMPVAGMGGQAMPTPQYAAGGGMAGGGMSSGGASA